MRVDPEYIDNETISDQSTEPTDSVTERTPGDDAMDETGGQSDSEVVVISQNNDVIVKQTRLLNAICNQNKDTISPTSIINVVSLRQRFDKKFDVVVSCDFRTFTTIMERQKLKISWEQCRVHEQLNVIRCFKYNAYGHTASKCNESVNICPICAKSHMIKDCPRNKSKCINCVRTNERLRMQLHTNHTAWNYNCPTYLHQMNLKRCRTRYLQ